MRQGCHQIVKLMFRERLGPWVRKDQVTTFTPRVRNTKRFCFVPQSWCKLKQDRFTLAHLERLNVGRQSVREVGFIRRLIMGTEWEQ